MVSASENSNSAQISSTQWKKSSLSQSNGHCVEVGWLSDDHVGVRHSKDRAGPMLVFTPEEWNAFVGGVRMGEFGVGEGANRC
jgi:hypothetical protein